MLLSDKHVPVLLSSNSVGSFLFIKVFHCKQNVDLGDTQGIPFCFYLHFTQYPSFSQICIIHILNATQF